MTRKSVLTNFLLNPKTRLLDQVMNPVTHLEKMTTERYVNDSGAPPFWMLDTSVAIHDYG